MARYRRISLVCLVVLAMPLACAPKWVGPTGPSGYYCSFHALDATIWLMLSGSRFEGIYPRSAEFIVTVKDGEGRPVNGVPVVFQVEPEWVTNATVTPMHALTQEGTARAVLEAETTGVIRVMASVENMTKAVVVTVLPSPEIGATSSE